MTEKRRESFIQGNLEYCFTKEIEDGCRVEKLKPAHFSLKVSSPWKTFPTLTLLISGFLVDLSISFLCHLLSKFLQSSDSESS